MRLFVALAALALLLVGLPSGGAAQVADTTSPDVVCGTADGLWHGADVTVPCTASDSESGLANPADASFDLTTAVPVGEENANAATDSRLVCDLESNCVTAGPVTGNQVDKKGPLVSCAAPDGLWHATDVTLACSSSDGGSDLADSAQANILLTTSVPDGTETANAATGSESVCDALGNCSPAGPVTGNKIDRLAPLDPTTVRSTDHRLNRWSRDRRVDMYWTGASDGGSGLDGFSYQWTQNAGSLPDTTKNVEQGTHRTTSPRLTTGKWWFHLRTSDNLGHWTSTVHRGPYLIDITRPQVRALSASGKVDRTIRLKYRTADNTHFTRERIIVSRNGTIVAKWSRSMAKAFWDTVQYVNWTPHAVGSYSLCVRAFDPARNSRRDCAGVSVTRPATTPGCASSYPGVCIPPPPPDLDCGDIPYRNFIVVGSDPHGFDGDGDGVGCET